MRVFTSCLIVPEFRKIALAATLAALGNAATAQVYFRDSGSYTFSGMASSHTVGGTTTTLPFFTVPLSATVPAGTIVNVSFLVSGAQISNFTAGQGSVLLLADPVGNTFTSNPTIGPGFANGPLTLTATATASSGYAKFGTIAWTPSDTVTLSSICVFGPGGCISNVSSADTLMALRALAASFKTTLVLGKATTENSALYDCDRFDAKGWCFTAIGRRLSGRDAGYGENAAAVMLVHQLSPYWRVGGFVDQANSSSSGMLRVGSDMPLVGINAIWNARPDAEGLEVRSGIAYRRQSLEVTRAVNGTSEAGAGNTQMSSTSASVTGYYRRRMSDTWSTAPYAGIRYYRGELNGYTEGSGGSVTTPLAYTGVVESNLTASLGVRADARFGKTSGMVTLGVDRDLASDLDHLSASGMSGLAPIAFDAYKPRAVRAVASFGLSREFDHQQSLGMTALYRQEAFGDVATTAVFLQYKIGF